MKDVLDMTLPQCEQLYNGICENNDVEGAGGGKQVIEGTAALEFLKQGNGKL